ncbi:hypothetical protein FACS1894216_16440 [Synergistales bacterium]|nr:hypothetical protein FACS1894216_16440 [Synergistales bacterium]
MSVITADKVVPFFQKIGVIATCECCGKDLWIICTNDVKSICIQTIPGEELSAIPVIMLECTNCGNLRIMNRQKIENYIKETENDVF